MSKPINFKDSNCESRSSTCVIWPGPEIQIGENTICAGTSVSQIIYDLATELLAVQAQIDIENWDLTAMEAEFGTVTDFKGVIQNILTKLYPPA